jgi:hypothetical protein
MRISRTAVAALTGLALLGASGSGALAADGTADRVIDGVIVDVAGVDTPSELQDYLGSDVSATIVLDATSGEVVSVTAGQSPEISSRAVRNVCMKGDACLVGPGVPFADYGFTTTESGWWASRTAIRSGNHRVNVTFSTGTTSATIAANKTAVFSSPMTVTKVKLG